MRPLDQRSPGSSHEDAPLLDDRRVARPTIAPAHFAIGPALPSPPHVMIMAQQQIVTLELWPSAAAAAAAAGNPASSSSSACSSSSPFQLVEGRHLHLPTIAAFFGLHAPAMLLDGAVHACNLASGLTLATFTPGQVVRVQGPPAVVIGEGRR